MPRCAIQVQAEWTSRRGSLVSRGGITVGELKEVAREESGIVLKMTYLLDKRKRHRRGQP